jgi:O-antigen/teichoic acid export membrane protein
MKSVDAVRGDHLGNRLQRAWMGHSHFRRSVSVLAGGTALAQLVNFASAPLLTRIYDAKAFGNLQVYGALLSFAMIVIAMRYELAIVLPQEDKSAVNVVSAALAVVLAVTVVLSFVVWFTSSHIWLIPGGHDLIPYLWLLPIGACGVGIYQVLVYWALRHHAYKTIAASKLTQVSSQAVVQLFSGLFTHGALLGLLVGDVCGRVGGSWRIARLTLRNDKAALKEVRPAQMWTAAKRYKNNPLVMTGAGLINSAGLQAVPLMLAAHYGAALVGLYALVDRTLQAPIALVAQSTSQVYIVQAAELGVRDPAKLRILFLKVVRSSLLYGTVPLALICLFAPWLFSLVFGTSWHAAGNYARILAPAYYLCFAHQCVCMTLPALERQTWQVGWDTLRLAAVVGVLMVCTSVGSSFNRMLIAYSVACCLCYAANLLLCYIAITSQSSRRNTHYSQQQEVLS